MEKIVCDPLFWCGDAGMLLIWGYNLGCNWLLWLLGWNCCFGKWVVWKLNFFQYYSKCVNEAQMGCVNEAQIGSRACCHITVHVSIHVVPCHHHFPRHCYVIDHIELHVIIAIHVIVKSTATSFFMSLLCDMAIKSVTKLILFVTLIFVIENGLGLGFRGPETFHDGFKTSWIKQSMTKI